MYMISAIQNTRWLNAISFTLFIAALCWLVTFKIFDIDFWWHVKAGDIIRSTRGLINTDPFSYAREGQAYYANHPWLAQVIFSQVWGIGGATAIIIFRWIIVSSTFAFLLCIDCRRIWINTVVALFAAGSLLNNFVDRPQLFTFLCFTSVLFLCFQYLRRVHQGKSTRGILVAIAVVQLLWVNMHGGASLMGILLFGALCLQRLWSLGSLVVHQRRDEFFALAITLVTLVLIVLFGSPIGLGNIYYVWQLYHDQTAMYIAEWAPHSWGVYLVNVMPFVCLSAAALIWTRRDMAFCGIALLGLVYASRDAARHESLLIFTALGVLFWQLKWNTSWQRVLRKVQKYPVYIVIPFLLVVMALGSFLEHKSNTFKARHNLYGFGTHEPAKGAFNFIVKNNVQGNIFNFDWGGYLSFRGWPGRKVFYDGRNVDFGYEFISTAVEASYKPDTWNAIERQYNFTHALIWYDSYEDIYPTPYTSYLDANPLWSLVYIDDSVALYLKDIDENKELINQYGYRMLTTANVQFSELPKGMVGDSLAEFEQELKQVLEQDDKPSWKTHLLLGVLYAETGRLSEAGQSFEQAVHISELASKYIHFDVLADAFRQSGDIKRAEYYRSL